jgi:hypothetical protein
MDTSTLDKVISQMKVMPPDLQSQVLEFVYALAGSTIQGVPGQKLVRFAGAIPPEDIQLIREAIEQDCEQVDINEW